MISVSGITLSDQARLLRDSFTSSYSEVRPPAEDYKFPQKYVSYSWSASFDPYQTGNIHLEQKDSFVLLDHFQREIIDIDEVDIIEYKPSYFIHEFDEVS